MDADYFFTVDADVNVVGQDGSTVVGRIAPGQQYKAVAENDHWVTIQGPDGSFGYVATDSITKVVAAPPPPPLWGGESAATGGAAASSPPRADTAKPSGGGTLQLGDLNVRPITGIGAVVVIVSSFLAFLKGFDDISAWDLPISVLWNGDSGPNFGLILLASAILGGLAAITPQAKKLAKPGGLIGLFPGVSLAIRILADSDLRDSFGEIVGIGIWISMVGAAVILFGAGRR